MENFTFCAVYGQTRTRKNLVFNTFQVIRILKFEFYFVKDLRTATFSQMYSEKNPLSVKPQIETLTNLAALYKITLLTILEQEYFQDITFVVGQH